VLPKPSPPIFHKNLLGSSLEQILSVTDHVVLFQHIPQILIEFSKDQSIKILAGQLAFRRTTEPNTFVMFAVRSANTLLPLVATTLVSSSAYWSLPLPMWKIIFPPY
jgi:hypothetical protein